MVFEKVANTADLQPGSMKGLEVEGKEILLVNVNGVVYAIGNRCTHMGCLLADGRLQGSNVICSCHGSTFDVRTGNNVRGPAKKPELSFQIRNEGNDILVDV